MGLQLRSPSNQIRGLQFAATGATVAKVPHVHNTRAFIPMNSADAAASNEHIYESEVSGAPKATGEAWTVGQAIYWDNTNKRMTKTSSGNTKVGRAVAAKVTTDVVVRLRIHQPA